MMLKCIAERNKVMNINEWWEELEEKSNEKILSEEGILKRQTRSFQTEGHFGDIKENETIQQKNMILKNPGVLGTVSFLCYPG